MERVLRRKNIGSGKTQKIEKYILECPYKLLANSGVLRV